MNYYAEIVKEKQNAKNEKYPHIQKEGNTWIVLYAEGTKAKEFDTEAEAKRFSKTVNNSAGEKENVKIAEQKENAWEDDIRKKYQEIQELKKKGLSGMDVDKYYTAINYRKRAAELIKEAEQIERELKRKIK